MIEDYCCKKAAYIRKKLDMYHRGIGAAIQFMVFKVTDDQFDGDPVLIIPGPFEGEDDE